MKRILCLLLSIISILSFSGCSVQFMKPETVETPAAEENVYNEGTLVGLIQTPEGSEYSDLSLCLDKVCSDFCSTYDIFYASYILPDISLSTMTDMIAGVVDDGVGVIILPGTDFTEAIEKCAAEYPRVLFIAVDVSGKDLSESFRLPVNVCCISFKEELAGFFAGYTAVALGYTHLGFAGDKASPGVKRYGMGFTQGANKAAEELEKAVTLEYVYAGTGEVDDAVSNYIDTWYQDLGVQLIFAVGDKLTDCVARSASEYGRKIIGADFDRFEEIDSYGEGICVSCAEKSYTNVVRPVLQDVLVNDKWQDHSAKYEIYGLKEDGNIRQGYVQVSHYATQWNEAFGMEAYEALAKRVFSGEIVVSSNIETPPEVSITVNYADNIK